MGNHDDSISWYAFHDPADRSFKIGRRHAGIGEEYGCLKSLEFAQGLSQERLQKIFVDSQFY
jgi:hypothetical protein